MVETGLSHESSPTWGNSRTDILPPLRLFWIKAVEKEEETIERVLVEKKEAQDGVFYDGLYELFNGLEYSWHYEGMEDLFNGLEYSKLSHFQRKVQKVMKVCRVSSGARDPIMKGRILGFSTNKYLRFVADTGSRVAIVPRSVAIRNKLEILPTDPDKASYAGVSGTRLSVVGQCQMYVSFRQMKTTKEVRALVVADEGEKF